MKLIFMKKFIFVLCLILPVLANCINNYSNNNQMKTITVQKVTMPQAVPTISQVREVLEAENIEFNPIDEVNWKTYPYKPDVKFRIAHSINEIYIQYVVREEGSRATFGQDAGSRPYTDSCVEFFMIPSSKDSVYYNLEMNCIGYGTFACGADRKARTRFGDEILSQIRRESSLGAEPFGDRNGIVEWTLTIAIPKSLYSYMADIEDFSKRTVRANFYKCGDDMKVPHFLSWNKVGCEKPNFHTPEYFGNVYFE